MNEFQVNVFNQKFNDKLTDQINRVEVFPAFFYLEKFKTIIFKFYFINI